MAETEEHRRSLPEDAGLVLLLDALGVGALSIEEARDFERNFQDLVKYVRKFDKPSGLADHSTHPQSQQWALGDTIVISWRLVKPIEEMIIDLGHFWGQLVAMGIRRGMLLRGAITYGQYIETNHGVLGPAIADAASWYEQCDWVGVIATPTLGLRIDAIDATWRCGRGGTIEGYFIKYNVPLRNGSRRKLWTVPWPTSYLLFKPFLEAAEGVPVNTVFEADMSKFVVPKGSESKYDNTKEYYYWYVEQHADLGFNIIKPHGAEP